ncbi:hypothetical protein [Streptomyces sp. NPDC006463]|uniref:hypothetical protein n=1 Tax=Streptomyces sp. NPDC006463 TaxID=3364746 RepID=UPI00369E5105
MLDRQGCRGGAVAVIGGAGSFVAVSELLGSSLVGAFPLREATELGGPTGRGTTVGFAIGIGAKTVAILKLPMTSVCLPPCRSARTV